MEASVRRLINKIAWQTLHEVDASVSLGEAMESENGCKSGA